MSTEQNLKMSKTKIFDIKGTSLLTAMASERMSLTCAPGGENHAGMEIIGRMPVKGEGFKASDIEGLGTYFVDQADAWITQDGIETVTVLDLNTLSGENTIMGLGSDDQARVLLLRRWVQSMFEDTTVQDIYKELIADTWDAEYLDKNKYRIEIVDGVETKVRGKRMNKRARTNLCYVAGREQEPDVWKGKGRIVDLKKKTALNLAVDRLRSMIEAGLIEIGSKTKVEINVVEGNRYYNLKNTGIGFHGDTERVVVICISIGCDNYPMRWQWFKDGMPVGDTIDITLNCGDVYIMSEKAVGADWKLRSIYTLRHAAGAKKYTGLDRWEKRRPAYEARIKAKAEKKSIKEAFKAESKTEAKPKKKKINKKIRKAKTIENYKEALRNLSWEDTDEAFYEWLAVEAGHDCTPQHAVFKDIYKLWTGNNKATYASGCCSEWNEKRAFYTNLCAYGCLF
jgi:hypothetical protein